MGDLSAWRVSFMNFMNFYYRFAKMETKLLDNFPLFLRSIENVNLITILQYLFSEEIMEIISPSIELRAN